MGPKSRDCDPGGLRKGSEIYIFNEHPAVDHTLRNAGLIDLEDPFQH